MHPTQAMHSDTVKHDVERALHRSRVKPTGVVRSQGDFFLPYAGACCRSIDFFSGHVTLHAFSDVATAVSDEAGDGPFVFDIYRYPPGPAIRHGHVTPGQGSLASQPHQNG